MRICVYGAGAIGGYLAGFLAESGAEVSVVARGAHLQAIQRHGLRVETKEGNVTAQVRASDDPATLGVQDAVIVSVKAPSLSSVAAGIGPLLAAETPVVFLNNGIPWWYYMGHGGARDGQRLPLLDPGDALWHAVGPARTVGGIFWPASAVPEPGLIRLVGAAGRGTLLGAPDGGETAGMRALVAAFEKARLPVAVSSTIRDQIWEKLAFNLSAGPMCVLTQTPVKDTHVEDVLIETSRRLMGEALALVAAMGRTVEMDMDRVIAMNRVLGHRPSILQDLVAGRPMEIDVLYSTPLQMAREAGVPMPTLEMLVALIKVRARAAGLYAG